MAGDEFVWFVRQVRELTGIDLTAYKRPQMERRLLSLRNKHGYADFVSYVHALRRDPQLLQELRDRITINVSEFFRNQDRWDALASLLNEASTPLRAWSAACARGEEPYTLAILMEERVRRPYKILATDIDETALKQAQAGRYRAHQLQSVPKPYLDKYFRMDADEWVIDPWLQRHVSFQYHNLLTDPFPTPLDLIICRNVLIYFTEEAKRSVVSRFVAALKPGGFLFVGSTEQFLYAHEYALRCVSPFVYQKRR